MSNRTSIRGIALATTAVVATTGITAAVHAVAAEPDPSPKPRHTSAAPVAAATPTVPDVSLERSAIAAGEHRADKRIDKRRAHAKAVRAARAAKERARAARQQASTERSSRSSVRTFTSAGGARGIAASMASSRYGWGSDQFSCLDSLWERESGWNVHASNPSGAYGIPQALPGSKMGGDWRNDAAQQISWGLGYIKGRYGDPCGAWGSFQDKGWY